MSSSNADAESPTLLNLQAQIRVLTDLQDRINNLRHIPPRLLRAPPAAQHPLHDPASLVPASSSLRLEELREFAESIKGDAAQDALKAARESEKARGVVPGGGRREKRKRPEKSLDSKSSISFEPSANRTFPPHDQPPLRVQDLHDFIRKFNHAQVEGPCCLHIYVRKGASKEMGNPVVLRFRIRDILVVFIKLVYHEDGNDDDMNGVLVVETVTGFGPRERKQPHMRSDYTTFQILSQQLTKMVESEPRVSLQTLIDYLQTYTTLFNDRCAICSRVLSAENHVPPVVRVWSWAADAASEGQGEHVGTDAAIGKQDADVLKDKDAQPQKEENQGKKKRTAHWEARHVTCLGTLR